MGKGSKRRPGEGFGDNYDKIFGKDVKPEGGRFVFDRNAQKVVRASERTDRPVSHHILPDIEPFQSPITGEVITSRSHLRVHHKEHGTTDSRDYSPEFMEKKEAERAESFNGATKADKQDRIERIKHSIDKHTRRR